MLEQQGTLCRLDGDVTLDTVPGLIEQVRPLIRSGIDTIDSSGVKSVDSSALGLFLACKREARNCNKSLNLTGLPPSLLSLASLYGVSDQL